MLCSRCGKRQAVVFVTNNSQKDAPTLGYCLTCAKELRIKPVEDLINIHLITTLSVASSSAPGMAKSFFRAFLISSFFSSGSGNRRNSPGSFRV